ncbi:hypothetical protein Tco_0874889 [Tanacetum coccineum]|uniref:Uncharacterized protein n=1 Tax=Tanacetum coccineum TaxID=301880 RepID=A0ABQ5BQW4_9ASTR
MLAEEEAPKAAFTNEYDFIQARLNADKILAEKLQEEEREKFTIEERAKFLHDTIAAQRRFLAQQRLMLVRTYTDQLTELDMCGALQVIRQEASDDRLETSISSSLAFYIQRATIANGGTCSHGIPLITKVRLRQHCDVNIYRKELN